MNKAIMNRGALNQTRFDSGRLTPLCVSIHIFQAPGEFAGTVLQDDNPIGSFHLSVSKDSPNKQVNFDLSELSSGDPRGAGAQLPASFELQVSGAGVFYVSSAHGGNAVVIRTTAPPSQVIFDSRNLDKGDVFLVTLLRPGQYTLSNSLTKIQSQVKVNPAAQTGGAPLRKLAIQTTNVALKQFGSASMELQAVQALAVRCDTPSRLTMQIGQVIDKPKPPVVLPGVPGGPGGPVLPGKPGGGSLKPPVIQPAAAQPSHRGKVTWRKQDEFKG